jgi:hypothetical protein
MGGSISVISDQTQPCEIIPGVEQIEGMASNSASPSDIWIVDLKPDITFEGEPLETIVMKMWLTSPSLPKMVKDTRALNYEVKVYKQIKRMIDDKVCSNFIEYITSGNCMGREIKKFPIDSYNFQRNSTFMDSGLPNRPSITQETQKVDGMFDFDGREYTILCTKPVFGGSLGDYLDRYHFTASGQSLIIQTLFGCLAMASNGITHNDLHPDNILITGNLKTPKTVYYVMDDKSNKGVISLKVFREAKIFDFDRAYSSTLGSNEILDEYVCKSRSQCNRTIPNLDMVKFLCYVANHFAKNDQLRDYVISWMIDNDGDEVEENILSKYFREDKSCFLRTVKDGKKVAIPDSEYSKFYSPEKIIRECIKSFAYTAITEEVSVKNIPEGAEVYYPTKRVL